MFGRWQRLSVCLPRENPGVSLVTGKTPAQQQAMVMKRQREPRKLHISFTDVIFPGHSHNPPSVYCTAHVPCGCASVY